MIKLRAAVRFSKRRVSSKSVSLENFISTDNILQNKAGIKLATNLPPQGSAMPAYEPDNILVANIRPYLKKIWFADREGGCSADVLVFDVNKGFFPKYIYYSIFQDDFFDHVMRGSKGTKMPRGDKNQILDYVIPDLDLSTQQKIAAVLSALDSKIELNNRINAELEAMAKTLYDYWFVQFDFPYSPPSEGWPQDGVGIGKPYKSSGGKMVWNEELKREIPEGWEVKELAEVATTIMRGISPRYREEGGICVLNQKCIRDQSINFEPSRRHDNELKDASSKLIEYGDVLVNSTGFGTLGRVAIVKRLKERITVVDSHITIVRSENVRKLFLGYSMLIRQSEIEGLAEGSTGQTELSRVHLGELKMVIPPIELQSVFEDFINPQFKKMANNEEENEQLMELRDWLLPMLMNGQVSVGSSEESAGS